jgi:hypothetical protein
MLRGNAMKRRVALVFGLFLIAGVLPPPAQAQIPPALSGTWMLDVARSDPDAQAQAGRGGRGGAPAGQLIVTQSATEITVQRGNQTFVYNIDGTEMPGPPGGETKSRIAWEGDKLVVTWKREFFAGAERGYQTSTGRDVYTLSGATLTVERTINNARGSGGTQTVKSVYNRSQ